MSKRKLTLREILSLRFHEFDKDEIEKRIKYFEEIISELKNFLDRNFVARLINEREFEDRMSELYFVSALRNNKLIIEHKSNKGLDIWIDDISGWGEFVCAHNAEEMDDNDGQEKTRIVNPNETLLRITTVLKDKSDKIIDDIKKGLIKENQPIILFLSTRLLIDPTPMNPEGDICSFVRALFPISEPMLSVNMTTMQGYLQRKYQYGISKTNGALVENNFFLDEKYSSISAIVFSYRSIYYNINYPESSFRNGDDFIIVHNPLARNPIKHGLLNGFEEYVCDYEKGVSFTIKDILAKEAIPQTD